MASSLTEYERRRQENIKKNQSLLSSLSIPKVIPASAKKLRKAPTEQSKIKKSTRKSSLAPPNPVKRHLTRASVKLSGGLGDTIWPGLDAEPDSIRKVQPVEQDSKPTGKSTTIHSVQSLTPQLWKTTSKAEDSSQYNSLFRNLKYIDPGDFEVHYSTGTDSSLDRLQSDLSNLKLVATDRVSPQRIYSLSFHPDPSRTLIFVGEKFGGVGIWDPLAPSTEAGSSDQQIAVKDESESTKQPLPDNRKRDRGEEEEEETECISSGKSYLIQVHTQYSSVSCIQTHPTHPHLIYTASYDRSIRELNFETQSSSEILDGELLSEHDGQDSLFSSFELLNEGREIWCADHAGGLSHRDLRCPKYSAQRWPVSSKKIGCLSLHPQLSDRWLVTASLNRQMRIWDLRALTGLPTQSELDAFEDKACVASYSHRLACSSAYFDPTGKRILSTCYDDLIRVWSLNSETIQSTWENHLPLSERPAFVPTHQAHHDNKTGRWVTPMKARWCPNTLFPSHFTVGNMKQRLDVYDPQGQLLTQLDHHSLTSVPAVTNQHPKSKQNQIAGGTAGGKVYLWM